MIGAAISVGVSSLLSYLQYKHGKITFEEMKRRIAKDGVKGAITGGALEGLSLFIPGGIIGFGIGFVTAHRFAVCWMKHTVMACLERF